MDSHFFKIMNLTEGSILNFEKVYITVNFRRFPDEPQESIKGFLSHLIRLQKISTDSTFKLAFET